MISADLTAASDALPLDLIKKLWEGITESGKFPRWAIDVINKATGP